MRSALSRISQSKEALRMELIRAVLIQAGLPAAVLGLGIWLLEKRLGRLLDKRQKLQDEREKSRRQYELCQLNMTMASMALAEATAKAVERIPDAHCNGDMHRALEYAEKVKNAQKDFLRQQAIDNLEVYKKWESLSGTPRQSERSGRSRRPRSR